MKSVSVPLSYKSLPSFIEKQCVRSSDNGDSNGASSYKPIHTDINTIFPLRM